jgi:hypothetical protein
VARPEVVTNKARDMSAISTAGVGPKRDDQQSRPVRCGPNPFVVLCNSGFVDAAGHRPEVARIWRPNRPEVHDNRCTTSILAGEVDHPPNGIIVLLMIGRARVQHQPRCDRQVLVPSPGQTEAIRTVNFGGALHQKISHAAILTGSADLG